MHKLYAIVSKEAVKKMNGIRGKLCAQTGHAFLHAFWDAEERFPNHAAAYRHCPHAYKITLVVDTDAELEELYELHKEEFPCVRIVDSGFTVFDEPTLTCIGIGPIREECITDDIRSLKLFC